jgi:hypothetical protein
MKRFISTKDGLVSVPHVVLASPPNGGGQGKLYLVTGKEVLVDKEEWQGFLSAISDENVNVGLVPKRS